MRRTLLIPFLALIVLFPASPAVARSAIRVGVADQSPAIFDSPYFQQLKVKRTRYFVPSDVMQDASERAKAQEFVLAARRNGVSTLLHVSTSDLREKRGPVVSTAKYRRDVGRIVAYFRKLGVRDFGAWNEVNHKTQETWNRVGNAGSDRYIRSFYARLSRTWRMRLKVVGIHNYSDVNRGRSTGTARIINTVRRYNRRTRFWFTETGALASFRRSFPYSESRQAARIKNMFTYASRYRSRGVERVYSYNFSGIENGGCGSRCRFDGGLVDPDGTPRPVFYVFKTKAANYSR
jgi:hypothetical protein